MWYRERKLSSLTRKKRSPIQYDDLQVVTEANWLGYFNRAVCLEPFVFLSPTV